MEFFWIGETKTAVLWLDVKKTACALKRSLTKFKQLHFMQILCRYYNAVKEKNISRIELNLFVKLSKVHGKWRRVDFEG